MGLAGVVCWAEVSIEVEGEKEAMASGPFHVWGGEGDEGGGLLPPAWP